MIKNKFSFYIFTSVLLILICTEILKAQTPNTGNGGLKLHFFPFTMLEFDGGIRAALEIPVSQKISLTFDYNHLLQELQKDGSKINFSGRAIRFEPRLFIGSDNDLHKQYFALQMLYKTKRWDQETTSDIADTLQANKDLSQQIYVLSFKMGRISYWGKNFGIDYYAGAGAGVKYNAKAFGEGFLRFREGYSLRPNILLGVSLFYRIK